MAVGPNDLRQVTLPTGWDAAELRNRALADGTSYLELIRDIEDALAVANGQLFSGWDENLLSITDDSTVEYRQGTTNGFRRRTEYSQPDVERADTTGHMLPDVSYDRAMGWTMMFLEKARRSQLDADIQALIEDQRNLFGKAPLERLFKMEEETGKVYGLGAGYSVPFADGGAGVIAFTPPSVPTRGGTFASTHNHFLRLNGITQANVETAVNHLWEHGHDGPFILLASEADVASWTNTTNVTGYKPRAADGVQYGIGTSLAMVGDDYIGVITTNHGTVYVRLSGRVPTGYWAVFKSYGRLDPRNPIRVYRNPMFGLGTRLAVGVMSLYPLAGAVAISHLGVGIADRTSAVLVENDSSGSYGTPTIS